MFKHSVQGAVRLGLLSTLAFCSTVSAAETTSTIKVGGPGSCSSEGFNDPGLLADGVTEASADMDFTFDDATGELTLVVTNTSPVLVGVNNPVITQIFFNVPLGITDVQLVDHFSNAGVAPSFDMTFDSDLMTNPNPNGAATFGAFSVELRTTNGVNNSIGNPDADTFSPANVSLSPTTFEMQVTGNYAGLTADDFT